ncbi:hypothetical protein RJL04_004445 [Salmonella enterica subsp. enterica serovar Infantis]|jgi:hypothetical protein|uniref:Uncharacterized protein n=2 Tax=Enterobacteriaceae TaxID=543 RepID=A0A751I448_SALTI|nr:MULTISPECIES: hypothetical protein [Enterobacteriaceae]EAP3021258.1 hypothetical protein [Salmonella enterica]EBC0087198.1 hypothetical protein [Salmonella enterica subsp. enterica serovar Enteritidis]EBF9414643.1 hypothetical protein [Salmonella enterica subsp. enterica serovar Infantis]EDQ3179093.1 hypothetical protein [Salmonella enterica subsp. enterica]EEN5432215.1 hypothetical protein [Salmonella enterica subsp. enterica serovar Kentucky]HAF6853567.1 hypothetical protein [Salmonella 
MSGRITTLCTAFGVVIAAVGLYLPYKNELNAALYQREFLTGKWSTDAEYIINSGDLGLDKPQSIMTIQLFVDKDGSIDGEFISEGLCDAMPLTWNITFNSDSPSLINFIFARKFQIRQLVNGAMDKSPVVATLKLVDEDHKHNSIVFDVVNDSTGTLPKQITLAKNLPKFEENYKYLQSYCANSTEKMYEKMMPEIRNLNKGL